jgi:hypothetical protein
MRSLISLLGLAAPLAAQTFLLDNSQPGWNRVLASLGYVAGDSPYAITTQASPAEVEAGRILLLTGHSTLAQSWGVEATEEVVEVRQARDRVNPNLPIVWEQTVSLPYAKLGAEWQLCTWERWRRAPLAAFRRAGKGAVVWVATPIGQRGYERYPFLPQALLAAGARTRVKGEGIWAFFDAGYRQRVDLPYLVSQWKQAGIGAIHAASWQFDEADAERAAWLDRLIALCHEHSLLVYAWVELPHVSDRFWEQYPECREKTASGQDASLDWRKLIALTDARCSALAEARLLTLLRRHAWDGANLGELYFESLEGHGNPARFTPFHPSVRADYQQKYGRDPLEDLKGEHLERLLAYRADLAAGLQADWLSKLAVLRQERPNFDIVLTHIDDRFDTRMRDALGADAARVLRGTEGTGVAFLIEDPATVWHLGPDRYREIRNRYEGLTQEPTRLAIDLNIVERYQDVYPTRQQTGAELAQLVHAAAASFDQVALYFEYSLRPYDLPLLAPAAARLRSWKEEDQRLEITLDAPALVAWKGPALVNATPWPLTDGEWLRLPAGSFVIEAAPAFPEQRLLETNARLESVRCEAERCRIQLSSRAGASLRRENGIRVEIPRGNSELELSVKLPAEAPGNSSAQLLLPH